jgi:hypothetical protein
MLTILFNGRHAGSQALSLIVIHKSVIPAGIAGIQATWKYLSSPSMAMDTRFPAGMTNSLRTCV